jgi:hypothetical protein
MSVTANDLVRRVRGQAGDWGKLTTALSTALTATDTQVTFQNMADVIEEELNFEVGLEMCRIAAVGQELDIERGANGTTPVPHEAGALAIVEPRFTNQELLDSLNAAMRKLAMLEPLILVSEDGDYVYDPLVQDYPAPAGALLIFKVDMEKATAGLYRPFYSYTVLEEYDPPVIRIPNVGGISGKRFRIVYGGFYPELAWDTETALPVKWHDFLISYANGVAVENEDIRNAQLKVQTGNANFRPGYAQQVGRNLQARAMSDLEQLRPATRVVRRPDQRQYRY